VELVLPLAPTVTLEQLTLFASPQTNQYISRLGWGSASLLQPDHADDGGPTLVTAGGVRVRVWDSSPAYSLYQQCALVVTTVSEGYTAFNRHGLATFGKGLKERRNVST
jgi:hypothetical protein